ncbi:MAG: hypothetical protein HOW73_32115 [Polyangiaceae bacterium]|nr:hypothetical protein [Polyangiaceae bacterium]
MEFRPYQGIGAMRFGATRQELDEVLGPPDSIEPDDIVKETRQRRGPLVLRFRGPFGTLKQVNRLRTIDISKGADVTFDGSNLISDPRIVEKLSALDDPIAKERAYMLFPKLGLCLGGYGKKKIPEGKLIIAFAKAALAEHIHLVETE